MKKYCIRSIGLVFYVPTFPSQVFVRITKHKEFLNIRVVAMFDLKPRLRRISRRMKKHVEKA